MRRVRTMKSLKKELTKVRDQALGQSCARARTHVRDGVFHQVWRQLQNQIWDQLMVQVRIQTIGQLQRVHAAADRGSGKA